MIAQDFPGSYVTRDLTIKVIETEQPKQIESFSQIKVLLREFLQYQIPLKAFEGTGILAFRMKN